MKRMLIIGGVLGVISFIGGLAGFYLMMPSVAPTLVEQTRLELDSLGLISVRGADSLRALRDALRAAADSLDSADSVSQDPTTAEAGGVADSLRNVVNRIRAVETEKAALLRQIDALTARIRAIEGKRAEAEQISATLAKLEDRQLGPILESLDDGVLELIYQQSSAKTQARLLAALPADRAAGFIRSLMKAGPATPPRERQPAATAASTGSSER